MLLFKFIRYTNVALRCASSFVHWFCDIFFWCLISTCATFSKQATHSGPLKVCHCHHVLGCGALCLAFDYLHTIIVKLEQRYLRRLAHYRLSILPRTGLDEEVIDPLQFGQFCTHVFAALRHGPRTVLIHELARKLAHRREESPDVEWLLTEVLDMPQGASGDVVRDNDVVTVQQRMSLLEEGKLYHEYTLKKHKADEDFEASGLKKKIRDGITKKHIALSEEEVEKRVEKIMALRERERRKAEEEAKEIWSRLQQDKVSSPFFIFLLRFLPDIRLFPSTD